MCISEQIPERLTMQYAECAELIAKLEGAINAQSSQTGAAPDQTQPEGGTEPEAGTAEDIEAPERNPHEYPAKTGQ